MSTEILIHGVTKIEAMPMQHFGDFVTQRIVIVDASGRETELVLFAKRAEQLKITEVQEVE